MSRVSSLMSRVSCLVPHVSRLMSHVFYSSCYPCCATRLEAANVIEIATGVGGRGLLSFDQINNAMVSSNLAHRAPFSPRCIAGICALTRNSTDICKTGMVSVTTNNTPVAGDDTSKMASAVVVVCPSAIHRTNPAAEVWTNRYSSCKLRRTSLREKPCQESWQQERKSDTQQQHATATHSRGVKHTHILPRRSLLLLVLPTT